MILTAAGWTDLIHANRRVSHGGVLVENPKKGSPEYLIQQVLIAGLDNKFEQFYHDLCHPDTCKTSPPKIKLNFKKFTWSRFIKRAEWYIVDQKKKSYKYKYTVPVQIKQTTKSVSFFLVRVKEDDKLAPIGLKRGNDSKWKVSLLGL